MNPGIPVKPGDLSTSWASACLACAAGSAWLAFSGDSLEKGLQCVRLHQAPGEL